MFPLLAPLLSSGASLLGSIFSSNTSAQNTQAQLNAQEQMQTQSENFNADQAQINRDYQTSMSNTAYQRASADMKAAGLNPMIMAGGGGSASTPGGSTASIGTPSVPMPQTKSPLGDLGANIQQGLNAAITAKTMDKMTDEIANLQATRGYITAQRDVSQETARLRGFEATREALAIPGSQFSAKSAEDLLSMPDWLRSSLNVGSFGGNKVGDVLNPIINSAGAVRRFLPTRSTSETTRDDGSSSFSERFNNIYGSTR